MFLKLLGKYNFFHGLGVTYYPSCLLSWSLIELEALKFVVPVLQKEINYKLENYGYDWGKCPLWAAIRKTENEVEKLKVRNEGVSTRKIPEKFKFKTLLKQIFLSTGESLSEALLFAEHGENMLHTKIVLNVRNNFCSQHVLPRFELRIFMY